jgi:hypothetical protein
VKADQKARGRYLGGTVPFGFRLGENGELVEHEAQQEAIREMSGLKVVQGKALRHALGAARAGPLLLVNEPEFAFLCLFLRLTGPETPRGMSGACRHN